MSVLFHISIYMAENLNISISFLSVSGSLVYCALSKFHFGFQQLLSENLPVVFMLIEDAVDSYSSLFLVVRFFSCCIASHSSFWCYLVLLQHLSLLFTSQLALSMQQSSDQSAGDIVPHLGFQLGNKTRPSTTACLLKLISLFNCSWLNPCSSSELVLNLLLHVTIKFT